jgi:hypothetical protein
MKSFSFAKAFTLGALLCMTLPVACGDDDDSSTPAPTPVGGAAGEGGTGGEAPAMLPPGISSTTKTEMCGADACKSAAVGPVFVDPCCDATDTCGLNTGFLALVGAQPFKDVCQAHDQAGDPNDACPAVSGLKVPFQMGGTTVMIDIDPFAGCCRPDGTCGVVVDKISAKGAPLANFSLGCIDAAPFMKGKVNKCSNESTGGAGGMGAGGGGGGEVSGGAPAAAGGAGGAGGAG